MGLGAHELSLNSKKTRPMAAYVESMIGLQKAYF
jgi:hypothetical protein